MKKIQELKEIADLNLEAELSDQDLAVVSYFKGFKDHLFNIFDNLSGVEKLSIIQFFAKEDSVSGYIDLPTLDFIANNSVINELLTYSSPMTVLDPHDIEILRSKGIELIPAEVILKNDNLIATHIKKESLASDLEAKVKNIINKSSGSRLVNLRNNVAMTSALMLGSVMFSSCNPKDISAKVNYQTQPPVISVPAVGQITGDFSLSFANHAASAMEDDELTNYKMSEVMLIQVPKVISQINYQSDRSKPTLTLTANGQYVCSYIWIEQGQSNPNALDTSIATTGEYRMHKSCYQEIESSDGLILSVQNIPKSKTITLKFNYEK